MNSDAEHTPRQARHEADLIALWQSIVGEPPPVTPSPALMAEILGVRLEYRDGRAAVVPILKTRKSHDRIDRQPACDPDRRRTA